MKVILNFEDIQKWLEDNGYTYILHKDTGQGGYEQTTSKTPPPVSKGESES